MLFAVSIGQFTSLCQMGVLMTSHSRGSTKRPSDGSNRDLGMGAGEGEGERREKRPRNVIGGRGRA